MRKRNHPFCQQVTFVISSIRKCTFVPSYTFKKALLSTGQKSFLIVFDKGVLYNESKNQTYDMCVLGGAE